MLFGCDTTQINGILANYSTPWCSMCSLPMIVEPFIYISQFPPPSEKKRRYTFPANHVPNGELHRLHRIMLISLHKSCIVIRVMNPLSLKGGGPPVVNLLVPGITVCTGRWPCRTSLTETLIPKLVIVVVTSGCDNRRSMIVLIH